MTTPCSTKTTAEGGVSDHGALTGLSDDDHPQYAKVDHADLHAHANKTTLDAIPDHNTAVAGQVPTKQSDGSIAFADQTGGGFTQNYIINGAFEFWQRGDSFSSNVYGPDRFFLGGWGYVSGDLQFYRETDPANMRVNTHEALCVELDYLVTDSGSMYFLIQRIEDVRTLAGKTVTFSFWAKASEEAVVSTAIFRYFTSSVSDSVYATGGGVRTIGTEYARYEATFELPDIPAGTAVDSNSSLGMAIYFVDKTGGTGAGVGDKPGNVRFWLQGLQLEEGSVATPFTRAGGSIGGELALCQRYYWKAANNQPIANLHQTQASSIYRVGHLTFPVPVRTSGATISATLNTGSTSMLDVYSDGSGCILEMNAGNTTTSVRVDELEVDAEL